MNEVLAIINVVNQCQCVILTQSEDQDRLLLGFNLLLFISQSFERCN